METTALENEALAEKDQGNSFYKKKEFGKALEHYDKAIKINPTNITFYTNKAAVYFEQGEHEKCRETCLKAIDIGRDHRADYKLIGKAFARIGNSFLKEKNFVEAKNFFNKSSAENETKEVREKIRQCEKEMKEAEQLAYINPDVALEEKTKGKKAFKSGQYEDAVKHFSEAIKRNPDDAKLYSSRASMNMKLKKFAMALRDCEKCVEKNPNLVKGHIQKGVALEALKEYDEAMDSYQKALELDPNAREATEAYYRCLSKDYEGRNDPESVRRRAMVDPEVQKVMSDPAMKIVIEQMRQDPKAASEFARKPETAEKLHKLIELGLIGLQ